MTLSIATKQERRRDLALLTIRCILLFALLSFMLGGQLLGSFLLLVVGGGFDWMGLLVGGPLLLAL